MFSIVPGAGKAGPLAEPHHRTCTVKQDLEDSEIVLAWEPPVWLHTRDHPAERTEGAGPWGEPAFWEACRESRKHTTARRKDMEMQATIKRSSHSIDDMVEGEPSIDPKNIIIQ